MQHVGRLATAAGLILSLAGTTSAQPQAARDPWVGQWRGAVTLPEGGTAPVVLTIVQRDGVYAGLVTGFEDGAEIRLARVSVEGTQLVAEATAESDLGTITVRYELSPAERALTGVQRYVLGAHTVYFPVELKRAARPRVPQPQVEQRLAYFLGEWELEYAGGEFPPLSVGTRSGRVRFTQDGDAPFLQGHVTGDLDGDAYEESVVIGYDAQTEILLFREILSNGTELLSLGNWQSPIAISFVTNPVTADGQVYQLRRLISIASETAFTVTDEFSVDGGPFRRLGNGRFARVE